MIAERDMDYQKARVPRLFVVLRGLFKGCKSSVPLLKNTLRLQGVPPFRQNPRRAFKKISLRKNDSG